MHKLDALTRLLEVEEFDAVLIFVRTRSATTELADRLAARGYEAAALNGDMPQKQREQTITKLRSKRLDILVATDVAARGLDVDRISHVINFDIPHDTESYIHRIGRTGRAGRTGEAILFAAPRERRMLNTIEQATGKNIEPLQMPSIDQVNARRVDQFKQRVVRRLAEGDLEFMRDLVVQLQQEQEVSAQDIAAALAHLSLGGQSLLLEKPAKAEHHRDRKPNRKEKGNFRRRKVSDGNELFRIEVGHEHGVQPGNIVGAIANEAGIDAEHIGFVDIRDDHSEVELPRGMPREIFADLKKVWVCGQRLNISRVSPATGKQSEPKKHKDKKRKTSKAGKDNKVRKNKRKPKS